jgi:hypothetical protein
LFLQTPAWSDARRGDILARLGALDSQRDEDVFRKPWEDEVLTSTTA